MLFLVSTFRVLTLKPIVETCWLRKRYSSLCSKVIWIWVSLCIWPITAELLLGSELSPIKVLDVSVVEDLVCLCYP